MTTKQQSVAPKERLNITYKSMREGASTEVELPLKMLMVGDYTLRKDDTPLEEREPVNINKENFNEVMAAKELKLDMVVNDRLSDEEDAEFSVSLDINKISDFKPENIANQVPELQKLLSLRESLKALKHPLANVPEFRKKMQNLMSDESQREQLLKELGLSDKD